MQQIIFEIKNVFSIEKSPTRTAAIWISLKNFILAIESEKQQKQQQLQLVSAHKLHKPEKFNTHGHPDVIFLSPQLRSLLVMVIKHSRLATAAAKP